ncbi:hypothetical protein GCM10009850_119920 [Nonomuraea monospora]|uniref:Secreted protein n=1 Tax=Nonomuraea monospora TaxID=568818 RepID=A0ABN3D3Y3_9ACTN
MSVAFVLVWPSQSAMVEVSTPACSSAIAAVWRKVCGVTCLDARVVQVRAATGTYLASRSATASRLRRPPVRLGNSGSAGAA